MANPMAKRRSEVVRRIAPWVAVWLGVQALVALAGRLAGRRLNRGDEDSTDIRRVLTMGGLELRPRNRALSSVQVDLAMGGVELDLTGLPAADEATPVDVRARVLMGGMAVRVPSDWRVWTSFRGVGGVGVTPGIQRSANEHEADLRVRGRVLFGGIGVEPAR